MTQPTTVAPDRDAGELVHRLMSVLYVDRAAVPDSIYQDLRRACAKCRSIDVRGLNRLSRSMPLRRDNP
jgi:hypothetical protein